MTKEPTLNDLTCALMAGVVRRVVRDLDEENGAEAVGGCFLPPERTESEEKYGNNVNTE